MRNNHDRDANYFIEAVRTRGGNLLDLIDAFGEVGMKRNGWAIVDMPCPSCGSVHVHRASGAETRATGSSLRIEASDEFLSLNIADGFSRRTSFSIACKSGPGCKYVMTASAFLEIALAAVGSEEFVQRARAVQGGDCFPVDVSWFAVYMPHAREKGIFFSPRTPMRALDKLSPGVGVRVLLQEVIAHDKESATSAIDPTAWVECVTDATGALLMPADIVAREQAEKQAREDAELEAGITAKLAELEAELRRPVR